MRIANLPLLLLALALPGAVAAQATYKCTDKAGKVTYTSTECHLLGLKPQGEVVDRMNTAPAYRPPPQAAKPAAKSGSVWTPPPNPAANPASPSAAGGEDKADPERRCFKVKTATGFATRCNERPEEEAKKP